MQIVVGPQKDLNEANEKFKQIMIELGPMTPGQETATRNVPNNVMTRASKGAAAYRTRNESQR